MKWAQKQTGFTIVELLIVVVVIAILATITIVAYNGIQNRAYDAAVQNDLAAIGKKITNAYNETGSYPQGTAALTALQLKVSKNAYSRGLYNGASYFNLVYCWPGTGDPTKFAIVAEGKSGAVFEYVNGKVSKAGYTYTGGSVGVCSSAGVTINDGNSRDWFYSSDSWQPYAG